MDELERTDPSSFDNLQDALRYLWESADPNQRPLHSVKIDQIRGVAFRQGGNIPVTTAGRLFKIYAICQAWNPHMVVGMVALNTAPLDPQPDNRSWGTLKGVKLHEVADHELAFVLTFEKFVPEEGPSPISSATLTHFIEYRVSLRKRPLATVGCAVPQTEEYNDIFKMFTKNMTFVCLDRLLDVRPPETVVLEHRLARINVLSEELARSNTLLSTREKELEDLRNQLNTQGKNAEFCGEAERTIAEKEKQIEDLQNQLKLATAEKKEMTERVNNLERELAQLAESNAAEIDANENNDRIMSLQEELARFREEAQQASAEITRLRESDETKSKFIDSNSFVTAAKVREACAQVAKLQAGTYGYIPIPNGPTFAVPINKSLYGPCNIALTLASKSRDKTLTPGALLFRNKGQIVCFVVPGAQEDRRNLQIPSFVEPLSSPYALVFNHGECSLEVVTPTTLKATVKTETEVDYLSLETALRGWLMQSALPANFCSFIEAQKPKDQVKPEVDLQKFSEHLETRLAKKLSDQMDTSAVRKLLTQIENRLVNVEEQLGNGLDKMSTSFNEMDSTIRTLVTASADSTAQQHYEHHPSQSRDSSPSSVSVVVHNGNRYRGRGYNHKEYREKRSKQFRYAGHESHIEYESDRDSPAEFYREGDSHSNVDSQGSNDYPLPRRPNPEYRSISSRKRRLSERYDVESGVPFDDRTPKRRRDDYHDRDYRSRRYSY